MMGEYWCWRGDFHSDGGILVAGGDFHSDGGILVAGGTSIVMGEYWWWRGGLP